MERGQEDSTANTMRSYGVISPMNHVGPDDIAIKPLLERVAQGGGWRRSSWRSNPDTGGGGYRHVYARLLKPFEV